MASTLIRGRTVIQEIADRREAVAVSDGGVLVEADRIAEVGPFAELRARNPDATRLGSNRHVVLPGFVNAHHHVGMTPVQLGSLDEPLEMWAITRIGERAVDPYLDTLYSAFEMLESGVTTVQHIFAWVHRDLPSVRKEVGRMLDAYDDVGMRVSFSVAMRDQNRSMLIDDTAMLAAVPEELRPRLAARFEQFTVPLEDQLALFEDLMRSYAGHPRIAIQLAPGNLHWCSDSALETVDAAARRHEVPLHIHLLETIYQREYARRRTGGSALEHLGRCGMLGPHVTLGHGVWMTEADIELAADTGTHICHNCSSNLRLRSGILPLNRLTRRGVNVALGIDEAGLNDDRDMLQEMRLVLRLHREPGMDERAPTAAGVLTMATAGGARTTPFAERIGAIRPGMQADLVLIDWDRLAGPYLDPDIGPIDAVLNRAKAEHVDTVVVGGSVVVADGEVRSTDKQAALAELRRSLAHPRTEEEAAERAFAKALYDPVRGLYGGYADLGAPEPFWRANGR